MKMFNKVGKLRVSVDLTDEQYNKIEAIASSKEWSVAQTLRKAVDQYLIKEKK